MKTIRVGLVGCGFVSELHMHAYKRVYGIPVSVEAVAAPGDRVVEFAKKHQIPRPPPYPDQLTDPEIDVIDICTPAVLHAPMIVEAMEARKARHMRGPFTGYFGSPDDPSPVGRIAFESP